MSEEQEKLTPKQKRERIRKRIAKQRVKGGRDIEFGDEKIRVVFPTLGRLDEWNAGETTIKEILSETVVDPETEDFLYADASEEEYAEIPAELFAEVMAAIRKAQESFTGNSKSTVTDD